MKKVNPNYTYLKEKVPKDRWTLLQGSTRSGKTWSIIHWLLHFCYKHKNANIEIDLVRDTFKAMKATMWKDFEDITKMLDIYREEHHHKTDHIYNLFGNRINYYGADDPKKIHGRKRDILIINEANHFPEETIDQLTPRTKYRVIADFNPALGREHWLDPYIDEYGVLITTYKDNPHLTDAQVRDIESKKGNKYWWSIYGEGKRANVEGAVFDNWIEGEFKINGQPILDSWFGLDFGYSNDPTALVECFITDTHIYAKEHVYETHLKTQAIGKLLQAIAKQKLVIADSAEPRLIDELRDNYGINIQGAEKVSINEGVTLMNDYTIVAEGQNLKKELSAYRWADKGKTMPIDDHNHCFTEGTLITTIIGEKPIKDIVEGDLVLTSNGFNRVLIKWHNGFKQVRRYSMQFDTFSLSLESTDSHKIKTEKGWTEISNLKANQKLYLSKYFLERNISSIKVNGIFQEVLKGFTELYGSIIKGKYQRGMIFTTLTVILQTMILKTLILSLGVCTLGIQVKKGLKTIQSLLKSFTRKVLKKRRNGIKAKRVESGTLNMVRKHGLTDHIERLIVKYAVKSIRLDTVEYQNTAIITARLKHLGKGEETRKKVYDLTVENEHEYFANGVLVHNCLDGLRYACLFKLLRPNYGKYFIG